MNSLELEEFGLSRNEAKIYSTLLRKGQCNSSELARESGVHRVNVYDVLNSLVAKGLVSYIPIEGKRIFKAENPKKLEELLLQKFSSLSTILPELSKEFDSRKEPLEISILRGPEGKKSQFEEISQKKNALKCTFIPHGFMTLERPPYNTILKKFYAKTALQKTENRMLVLDTPEARKRSVFFKEMPNVKIRFLKEMTFSQISWDVCEDLLFLTFFIEPYLIIRIKSKEIANAFYNNFNLLWKNAKR